LHSTSRRILLFLFVSCTALSSHSLFFTLDEIRVSWGKNRCAVDAMWSLATCMDLFRTQTDQQDWDHIQRMARMPALLRRIMLRDIGTRTSAQRVELRDLMAKELHKFDPTEFETTGFWDVVQVLQVCLSTVPQPSFTEIMTTICCDKVRRIIPAALRAMRTTGMDLSSVSRLYSTLY
jgi:hypothetical protein